MSKISEKIKNADIFCFDVDSTVLNNEGIDQLSKYLNLDERVSEITNITMNGDMSFEESLDMRLNIIKPSVNDIKSFIDANLLEFTDGIIDFIQLLQKNGKIIYLISGGFESLILPYAKILNIPKENVIANRFIHNSLTGEYMTFDKTSFTSKSGGKKEALQSIKNKYEKCSIIMIGDGVTDLEAKTEAELFIGFGGIVERKIVKDNSDCFIKSFHELSDIMLQ